MRYQIHYECIEHLDMFDLVVQNMTEGENDSCLLFCVAENRQRTKRDSARYNHKTSYVLILFKCVSTRLDMSFHEGLQVLEMHTSELCITHICLYVINEKQQRLL